MDRGELSTTKNARTFQAERQVRRYTSREMWVRRYTDRVTDREIHRQMER
jgi:hypothetical protein